MIVIADSSPLIVLVNIEHVAVLSELFGKVIIPTEVAAELKHSKRPQYVRDFIASRPAWLLEQAPANVVQVPGLHSGELAAISLALELHADLLLIDEVRGRQAAAERQIPITGTIGVLEIAADRGLLDLAGAFAKVKATDFWISHELLDQRLELHRARQQSRNR